MEHGAVVGVAPSEFDGCWLRAVGDFTCGVGDDDRDGFGFVGGVDGDLFEDVCIVRGDELGE